MPVQSGMSGHKVSNGSPTSSAVSDLLGQMQLQLRRLREVHRWVGLCVSPAPWLRHTEQITNISLAGCSQLCLWKKTVKAPVHTTGTWQRQRTCQSSTKLTVKVPFLRLWNESKVHKVQVGLCILPASWCPVWSSLVQFGHFVCVSRHFHCSLECNCILFVEQLLLLLLWSLKPYIVEQKIPGFCHWLRQVYQLQ